MSKLASNVRQNASKRVRATALAIDGAVVIATPVDEGRARSNWQVSIDSTIDTVREAYAPGSEGSTGGANARAAIEQGRRAIEGFGPDNKEIHITNNLPYIRPLNDGHSAQAPANFVEQAVAVGVEAGRKIKLLED
jgi:hypothetical protein